MLPTGHDRVRLEDHPEHVCIPNTRMWRFRPCMASLSENVTGKRELVV